LRKLRSALRKPPMASPSRERRASAVLRPNGPRSSSPGRSAAQAWDTRFALVSLPPSPLAGEGSGVRGICCGCPRRRTVHSGASAERSAPATRRPWHPALRHVRSVLVDPAEKSVAHPAVFAAACPFRSILCCQRATLDNLVVARRNGKTGKGGQVRSNRVSASLVVRCRDLLVSGRAEFVLE
jgi:hypothetical protein